MWVRRAAIRPVPTYARIPEGIIEGLSELFSADTDDATRERLDDVFTDFEERQPALAAYVAEVLGRNLDDTALALGYFLMTATWLAFDTSHSEALEEVSQDLLNATRESLALDEQLRISDPAEPLDSDDVVAMEQPHLLEFINDHVSATLEAHQDDIEVDDVHAVYRMTLIAVLALSYAVKAPRGFPLAKTELMA
ncbi:MAG: hypothetical protein KIT72_01740 [Polyangiaceae bacterium]|nr:hypothetical protein [Polyangiaceae bacterium]MCW5789120.1 hypothetical protein [Polyangiaceae bacterium]